MSGSTGGLVGVALWMQKRTVFRGRTSEYSYFSFSSCPIDCQFYVKFTQLDARMFKYSIYLNICNVVVTY